MARKPVAQCVIDGCDRPVHGHGWCSGHLYHVRVHGTPYGPRRRRQTDECRVEGCHQTRCNARDLCMAHYARWLRTGSVGAGRPIRCYRRKRENRVSGPEPVE